MAKLILVAADDIRARQMLALAQQADTKRQPQLVCVDPAKALGMPGLIHASDFVVLQADEFGMDVFEHLRQRFPEPGDVPCILVTPQPSAELLMRAMRMGVRSVLRWPLDPEPGDRRGRSPAARRHGARFAGRPAVVVGGGDVALEEAALLAQVCSHVTLVHRGPRLRARPDFRAAVAGHPRITVLLGTRLTAILGDPDVEGAVLAGPGVLTTIPCSAVVVCAGKLYKFFRSKRCGKKSPAMGDRDRFIINAMEDKQRNLYSCNAIFVAE